MTVCHLGECRLGDFPSPYGNRRTGLGWGRHRSGPVCTREATDTRRAGLGGMASEIAALRARVQTLESENGKLASTLRKQESASRTMTEGLQSELARIQHLCNELSYTMVPPGATVDANFVRLGALNAMRMLGLGEAGESTSSRAM